MPALPKSRRRGKGANAGRSASRASAQEKIAEKKSELEAAMALPDSISYLGGKLRTSNRRARCFQQFDELAKLICALQFSFLTSHTDDPPENPKYAAAAAIGSSSSAQAVPNRFPILQVGHLARALGLNISNRQVVSLVELVEDDGPSTGSVETQKLRVVLVDAMMTGTVGGPALYDYTIQGDDTASSVQHSQACLSLDRLNAFTPFLCVRDEEVTLLRAFEALDTEQKGYLEEVQLRSAMQSGEEAFSIEEWDQMWVAICDPQTNRAYYRDFVEILSGE